MKTLFAFLFLTYSALATADTTIGSVKIPDAITLGEHTLKLNGAGIRKKCFINVYVGALCTTKPSNSAEQLITSPGHSSMQMHITYKKLEAKKIRDAWQNGFQNNLSNDALITVKTRLAQFNTLFPDLHKGDVMTMNFQPGRGTAVLLNGSRRGLIEGDDFFTALLRVWLGDKPADAGLKQSLVGK